MEGKILDPDAARRLARTIAGDLSLYNRSDVEQGLQRDDLFEALAGPIEEGRRHFEERVDARLFARGFFEKALVDFLLKPFASVRSGIW